MVMIELKHPIEAIIFDWAGTTVDYGSRAPTSVFIEVFRRNGVAITADEARGPMGRAKRDHIVAIATIPRVAALWSERYGRTPSDIDIDQMYYDFLPRQKEALVTGTNIIPGIPEAVETLRSRGLKIGSSTGYARELMDIIVPLAAQAGYSPDVVICADDVPSGRPAPWMNFLAAQQLGIYPMDRILVVDDTPIGIEAGLNAGAITVAVTKTGNSLGLSESEVSQLSPTDLQFRLDKIESDFKAIGAHFTIPSVADLPGLLY
jgi:phosphonoacetaldehyde hydrolase